MSSNGIKSIDDPRETLKCYRHTPPPARRRTPTPEGSEHLQAQDSPPLLPPQSLRVLRRSLPPPPPEPQSTQKSSQVSESSSSLSLSPSETLQYMTSTDDRRFFKIPSLIWFIIIPVGLLINFLTWYDVRLLPINHMGFVGTIAVQAGEEKPIVSVILNLIALTAHVGEAVYSYYLASSLRLEPLCKFKWFLQTLLLGFPSLRLLLKAVSDRKNR